MRGPAWLQSTGTTYQREGTWVQDFRVRHWHPSFLGELWRVIDVKPRWAKPILTPVFWVYLVVKKGQQHG